MAALTQLDTENADRDLSSEVAVLTHTPDASNARRVMAVIKLGDGTKDLDGTGGDFTVRITVGGQNYNGGGETKTIGTEDRVVMYTEEFIVPANNEVVIYVTSPNAGDTDVDTTCELYELNDLVTTVTGNVNGSVAEVTGGINTSGGTITTLDDLDTAQDTQHGTTQTYLSNNLGVAGANATEAGGDGNHLTEVVATLADSENVYHANIEYTFDDPEDEYTVTWFKNGQRVSSGITSPTIQVVKRSDGTDLVASTAMTQIGSTGSYKYDEASNVIEVDEAYLVIVGATIDSSGRSFSCLIKRSS